MSEAHHPTLYIKAIKEIGSQNNFALRTVHGKHVIYLLRYIGMMFPSYSARPFSLLGHDTVVTRLAPKSPWPSVYQI